jgi:hypothetical protein
MLKMSRLIKGRLMKGRLMECVGEIRLDETQVVGIESVRWKMANSQDEE